MRFCTRCQSDVILLLMVKTYILQNRAKWLMIYQSLITTLSIPRSHFPGRFPDYSLWSRATLDSHDDVIKWKHFPPNWPFVWGIYRSTVNSPHKGQWRGALRFSLIYAWMNSWANHGEAGDLRRLRAHCYVIVMNNPVLKVWYLYRPCHFWAVMHIPFNL